ncbi:MAG TPA: cytochrome c oxidase subunit II [Candidatus Aquilonibacter sp.]|nr:cytochrome c oxidase subunit II [Candidatus Aquilonibacter sp.]
MSAPYGTNAFTLAPASPQALAIAQLFTGTLIYLGAILVLVTFLVIYAIVRYRDRPGAPEPKQIFGWRNLEIVWTAIPILSLIVLIVFVARTMHAGDPPDPEETPDLRIVGHQWWWEFDYLKNGVITANELHIPIGQRLLVEFRSADVIHDFWAPELARKMDIIPGHPNRMWLEASRPGTYLGVCAEFCGNEHAWMRFQVIAQPAGQYEAWVKQQLAMPPKPTSADAQRGAQLFVKDTCANCHTIMGTAANQRIGPDLSHLATRRLIAAGAAENSPENLALWLHDPDTFKPGSHMPNLKLSNEDVRDLVAYLETLK